MTSYYTYLSITLPFSVAFVSFSPDCFELLIMYISEKVDDDYLYSWYRALYMLFQNEGYRLYHSGASDSLCLQVTLMESCIYYLSWIRDPGPQTFILYPPSIDGKTFLYLYSRSVWMVKWLAPPTLDHEVRV